MKKYGFLAVLIVLSIALVACDFSFTPTSTTTTDDTTTGDTTTGDAAEPAAPKPETTEAPAGNTSSNNANVIYSDDFSDPTTGWEIGDYVGGSVGYDNGVYSVSSNGRSSSGDAYLMWGVYQAGGNFSDIRIDVDATQVFAPANDNNAYGVFCRRNGADLGNSYAFFVSGDGYYSIQLISNGGGSPLVDWTSTPYVNLGNATNHLTVICDGSYLAFYVNDNLLAEVTDTTNTTGELSLAAVSFESTATLINFDNLVVANP